MKLNKQQLLFIAVIFFWFAQYVYIPYQTPYLTMIQTSTSFIGIIIGTYGISQMVLRVPVGLLADYKNKHKTIMLVGALSSGCASLFRILLNNGIGFLIGNLFSGLASAMWISFMVLYMSFYPKDQQTKATSSIIVANNLGMLLGFITSTLLYEKIGMQMICLLSVISGIISALFISLLPKEKTQATKKIISGLLKVCTQKNLIVFSLLALVQQGVQMTTTMSFTTQIIKNLGASSTFIGLSSIIYMLSAVCFAKMASSDLCMKLGVRTCITVTFLTTALYCISVPQCTSVYMIFVLQILPGMATGILFSYLTSEAMKYVPQESKSTAMGFFQAVYALGMTLFPMICGNIVSHFSMFYAYLFLAVICLIAASISFLYCKFH